MNKLIQTKNTIKSLAIAALVAGSLSLTSFVAAADEHRGGKKHKSEGNHVTNNYHDKRHTTRSSDRKKYAKDYRRYPNHHYADDYRRKSAYKKRHNGGHKYGHHNRRHEKHYVSGYHTKRIHRHDHIPVIESYTLHAPHRHYSPRLSLGVHLGHLDLLFVK